VIVGGNLTIGSRTLSAVATSAADIGAMPPATTAPTTGAVQEYVGAIWQSGIAAAATIRANTISEYTAGHGVEFASPLSLSGDVSVAGQLTLVPTTVTTAAGVPTITLAAPLCALYLIDNRLGAQCSIILPADGCQVPGQVVEFRLMYTRGCVIDIVFPRGMVRLGGIRPATRVAMGLTAGEVMRLDSEESSFCASRAGPAITDMEIEPNVMQATDISANLSGSAMILGNALDADGIGCAFVYEFGEHPGDPPIMSGKLVGLGAIGASMQGCSAAMMPGGSRAAIAGDCDDNMRGAVWFFSRSGLGRWVADGPKLTPPGPVAEGTQFGAALAAISDSLVAVGSIGEGMWLISRESGSWQIGEHIAGAPGTFIGAAVAAGSNLVAMSDYQSGRVWTYSTAGTPAAAVGESPTDLTPLIGMPATNIGRYIAISSDGLILAASIVADSAPFYGVAVFERVRTGRVLTWGLVDIVWITAPEQIAGHAGAVVALSEDGRVLVASVNSARGAYVFQKTGSRIYSLVSQINAAPDGAASAALALAANGAQGYMCGGSARHVYPIY